MSDRLEALIERGVVALETMVRFVHQALERDRAYNAVAEQLQRAVDAGDRHRARALEAETQALSLRDEVAALKARAELRASE